MRQDMQNTGKEKEMPHYRTPMTFKVECLRDQGYDKEFQICEEGLRCLDTNEMFQPDEITIVEHQRFEGVTNPDDMAILYVVETNSGLKGTIVAAYGVYADSDLFDFMKQVKDNTQDNTYSDCSCEKIS
jgi:hypothetical protein